MQDLLDLHRPQISCALITEGKKKHKIMNSGKQLQNVLTL